MPEQCRLLSDGRTRMFFTFHSFLQACCVLDSLGCTCEFVEPCTQDLLLQGLLAGLPLIHREFMQKARVGLQCRHKAKRP